MCSSYFAVYTLIWLVNQTISNYLILNIILIIFQEFLPQLEDTAGVKGRHLDSVFCIFISVSTDLNM